MYVENQQINNVLIRKDAEFLKKFWENINQLIISLYDNQVVKFDVDAEWPFFVSFRLLSISIAKLRSDWKETPARS